MCILIQEIEYLVLNEIFGSLKENITKDNLCKIVDLALVCKDFNNFIFPFLQELNTNPIEWSIQYENKEIFEFWFSISKIWFGDNNLTYNYCKDKEYIKKLQGIINFDKCNNTCNNKKNNKTKENFSRYVFSLAGKHNVSQEFLKYLWMTLNKNGFYRFSLEDYFENRKEKYQECKKPYRIDLLSDNSALNIIYYIEMYYTYGNGIS